MVLFMTFDTIIIIINHKPTIKTIDIMNINNKILVVIIIVHILLYIIY